ncbi:UNVERIFIED_CONTAM: hypothetical protein FKN15_013326 [Acipenser sinensis]
MAELGGRQAALQAEGHCIIVVEGEEGTVGTSSHTEMEGAQVRIKQEAMPPPDTHTALQDVNKGAYYCQLQYDEKKMDKVDAYMERWHEHQRELKEGGATWCLACLEYGHLPEVCPYEDPLFVQAFDRGEVETAEEWIHLKAIPSPQVDQETCLTCLKGEEWCFAVGKVGHKSPDQPPPWQEVELLVSKKGRSGGAKKAKKQAPAPEWEQPECPQPKRGESVRPQPRRGRGKLQLQQQQ